MNQRADEIRKRLARRRKQYPMNNNSELHKHPTIHERDIDEEQSIFHSEPDTTIHPLWNKELFFMKILGSALIVLIVAIIYQTPSPMFEQARSSVQVTMEKEFQFAAVGKWYEGKFGKPLALFPTAPEQSVATPDKEVLQPVAGKVLAQFADDGRGIILETSSGVEVEAMTEGRIIFAGKQEDIGNTVIIQHPDKSESWYGKLDEITVKPYEKVSSGKTVGTVSTGQDGTVGEFYFAIKREDKFIDPIQVMNFD
ncbi:M23 family metallopeptidase [Lederbergia lenta]|uniref:Stage IV sporulation protein FA n=1 Tax=Lederbergia lenta TaxID=1467 RepID=A0A2X4WA96_LEDLE|nr:M23 family metallopeptidase [Lederbergia lenta]MCM3111277.1 M23 family metallopeptidase [Lederbergia lenta]MEC2325335.1 M23 family metallopeptidase [Lederbergia lenta]SQI55802.1 stage IV sporulation protein FA [Lederbergia lenta]